MTVTGFTFGDGSPNTVASSWSATVPAGVQAGNVLVVEASQNTGTATFSISGGNVSGAGWSKLSGEDYNGTVLGTDLWIATATGTSAGSTITITSTVAGRFIGVGAAVTGVTATGALATITEQSTASTSMPFPSATIPDGSGWTELGFVSMRKTSSGAASLTAPSGSTLVAQTQSGYGSSAEFTDAVVAVNAAVGSGSQSPGTGTASASIATANLYTVALAPLIVSFSGSLARTGSGALSLTGTVLGSLSRTGSGSLTLTGTVAGTLTRTGSGALALGGTPTVSGGLARTGSGSLTFGGTPTIPGTLARTGSGALALGGKPIIFGALARTGSGLLTLLGGVKFRFAWWDGSTYRHLTPLVWDGQRYRTDVIVNVIPDNPAN